MKQVFILATQVDFQNNCKFLWKNIIKSHTIKYRKIVILAESKEEALEIYKEKYYTETPIDMYWWSESYEGYSVDLSKMSNIVYSLISYPTTKMTIDKLKEIMTAEDFREWFWEGRNYDM